MPDQETTEVCGDCGGSGYVQRQRGAGVWEDWECPVCAGTGQHVAGQPGVPATDDAIKRLATSLVRRHQGRIYLTLAGVEHGMSEPEAAELGRALVEAIPPRCPLRSMACSRYEVVIDPPADPRIWACVQAACPLSIHAARCANVG